MELVEYLLVVKSPTKTNRIEFINVDTAGDTSDFGDANNNLTSLVRLFQVELED